MKVYCCQINLTPSPRSSPAISKFIFTREFTRKTQTKNLLPPTRSYIMNAAKVLWALSWTPKQSRVYSYAVLYQFLNYFFKSHRWLFIHLSSAYLHSFRLSSGETGMSCNNFYSAAFRISNIWNCFLCDNSPLIKIFGARCNTWRD